MYRSPEEIAKIKHFFSTYDWQWTRRGERKWWPKFCFHHTDLSNIPTILDRGYLYSRSFLQSHQIPWFDVASQQVLENTKKDTLNSVRFYFRPRTPTQYRIEGIKSKEVISKSEYKQHCPIPVFLLFDIIDVLSREKSLFSDGNLGSCRSITYNKPEDLYCLPWKQIYHIGSFDPLLHREIKRQRCAEIIIPEKVDLEGLKFIFCRSEAEKETLLNLLEKDPIIFNRYSPIISSSGKYELFEKQHTFIEEVNLSKENIQVSFFSETKSPGPFDVKVIFYNEKYIDGLEITKIVGDIGGRKLIHVPKEFQNGYTIELYLDNYLVYRNSYIDTMDYSNDIVF